MRWEVRRDVIEVSTLLEILAPFLSMCKPRALTVFQPFLRFWYTKKVLSSSANGFSQCFNPS